MNKSKLLGLVGLVGAAFVGGGIMPSIIRLGTSLMHPFILNWLRIFLGLIITLIIFRKKYQAELIFKKKHLFISLLLGSGLGFNITMFSFGIQHTTLVASQLIYTITPIVTGLIAFVMLKEKISPTRALGMAIALAGVLSLIIFSISPEEVNSLGTFYGNFLIFIGMFGYSFYLSFSKKLSAKFSIIEMVILTNISLSILLFPMAVYGAITKGTPQFNLSSLGAIFVIAASAIIFMGLSQLAIKHLSAGTASLGSLLSPEFAALTGIVVYHERLSLLLLLSMTMSIGGVLISVTNEKNSLLGKIKITISKLRI